ncbi:hypothetical protein C5C95_06270 [Rathayibacter sp. AY1B7]|uniref:DUF4429 domain-containing protein n=1 Tax=Rathayibacter sp. AY1B7 TaxID=2080532 RepID=UPI000CE88DF7|nr:DUF4429 domain-containing protein [Rathayibacter sp. AY1B7]PPH99745.1 hypothetical protein C5C95_06270 [Rathayibacter sp. AY1B7]
MADISFKGSNGAMTFDGRSISITRKGLGAAVFSGARGTEKQLPIAVVSSIQYKKGGLTVGYIQLTVPGDAQKKFAGKTQTIQQDENAVTFYSKQNDEAKQFAEAVNEAIHAAHQGTAAPAAPDLADQLQKLAGLRDAGVLTEDEFAAKKAELLARM